MRPLIVFTIVEMPSLMGYHIIREEMQQFCNMLTYLYPWSLNSIESPFRELTDIQVDNIMEFVLRSVLGNPSWLDTTIEVPCTGGQQSLRTVLNKISYLAILRLRGTL